MDAKKHTHSPAVDWLLVASATTTRRSIRFGPFQRKEKNLIHINWIWRNHMGAGPAPHFRTVSFFFRYAFFSSSSSTFFRWYRREEKKRFANAKEANSYDARDRWPRTLNYCQSVTFRDGGHWITLILRCFSIFNPFIWIMRLCVIIWRLLSNYMNAL